VVKMLELGGAKANQVIGISLGEEYPADTNHNEAAWQKNRRTDLNYTK